MTTAIIARYCRRLVFAAGAFLLPIDPGFAADRAKGPPWPDTAPLSKRNIVLKLGNGGFVRADVLRADLFRIRHSKTARWTESALNRYGIFARDFSDVKFDRRDTGDGLSITTAEATLTLIAADGSLTLADRASDVVTKQSAPKHEDGGGYDVRFDLATGERLYGLGDASRENIMRRGGAYEMWVRNVKAYAPIPVLLSDKGWGLLINTTWRNNIDVGKTDPGRLICTAPKSDLDYYLFVGSGYRALLEAYTSLAGRPALLPAWGYAFTYVCNENIDAFHMMNEALTFRRERMPCDVIGLEPGWMSKNYDGSTAKQWHPERFPIPKWAPKGPHTFPAALGRKGFKLSLWLCCDHDLGVFEEEMIRGGEGLASVARRADAIDGDPDDFEKDERLNKPDAKTGAPVAGPAGAYEPWFEHLKKFVDQGAAAFKLDGAYQVIEHPKRNWGNGMTDEEMHNLYPVIYAKQMARGFEAHTGRRSMVYSAGGYAGVQQFVATWAGDTGGGPKPLASMLNHGFSGHSNHSCDMDVFSIEGIHFGFLQTWAQQNNWAYWRQPWLLEDDQTRAFRAYGQLRYKLMPYLYSTAAEAALTGYPVMRAMSMVWPDDPAWDSNLGQYMLGDFLLVSAFSKEVRLPAGVWIDFWSGDHVKGPATIPVRITPDRGGSLFVKGGAIIPTWPPMDNVRNGWSAEIGLLVYPHGHSAFTLYEDDGVSLAYRNGKSARTVLRCEGAPKTTKLIIDARQGDYAGMPAARDFTATVHLTGRPGGMTLDGANVTDWQWDAAASTACVRIPQCGSTPRTLIVSH